MSYNYIQRAKDFQDEAIDTRRHLHKNPEIGYDLPETYKFVKSQLDDLGIEFDTIDEYGLVGTLGNPDKGKTILLRADMDALEIPEKSGLDFASEQEGKSHTCGHDMHTTILLGALRLLKEDEDELEGQVKFLFQPAEETLTGGQAMLDDGILENPRPDAGMALHMAPNAPGPAIGVINHRLAMSSANNFRIKVKGNGSHGAMPFNGVDPVYIASQIVVSTPELIARELPFDKGAAITMGKIHSDGAVNVIPNEAIIEGTVRTLFEESREHIKERLPQMVEDIAKTYRGEVEFEFLSDCPALINNPEMTEEVTGYLEEAMGDDYPEVYKIPAQHASEDFAYIAAEIPSVYYNVFASYPDDNDEVYPVHHPKVRFNEDVLPLGSGTIAHSARRWLENNK